MTSKNKIKPPQLKWQVGVALDPTQNDVPIFVGRGTNTDVDGNVMEDGFSFDIMFHKKHPLSLKLDELSKIEKSIRIIIVDCDSEQHSIDKTRELIQQYGLVKDGGTLLNLSADGEGEGRTYSGSPSKMLH